VELPAALETRDIKMRFDLTIAEIPIADDNVAIYTSIGDRNDRQSHRDENLPRSPTITTCDNKM
jgi:hypothetical protein